MRATLLFSFFALLSSPLFAVGENRPAPDGFHWQKLEGIHASVLAPDGWSFFAEEAEGKKAYFITQEKFSPPAGFKTGYSLNCIKGVSQKTRVRPSAYIEAFTRTMDGQHSLIEPRQNTTGPFKMIWFGVIAQQAKEDATRMTYMLIANDVTDTAYVAIFEAPLADWEKAYQKGYPMLRNLALEPLY